ncbi:DUF6989 domain-containing protein [Nonlabens marinus]|uniref:DUF6989 domain-containing protein n=1 Tax=Nonlabens marinus S1-08 TaxID=1454201 RepID=W8VWA5_9FLAO|nr:hypothetical protein [Nonlabens marinus]BAO56153.1 hypothetical protein NMS_2144 [Nonlabens marinus S1-08]
MFHSLSKVLIEFFKAILKVSIAGVAIGLLKTYPFIVAGLILIKLFHVAYVKVIKPEGTKNWILITGMLMTGVFGIVAEYWGVSNDYWEYHYIDSTLPAWLPFAWMMAFYILYQLEHQLVPFLKNPSLVQRIVLMIVLTLIIPAIGEMVAINMGVWTYTWPYQLLGVPVYAFIALVLIHMFVYLLLYLIFKNSYGKMLPFAPTGIDRQ